MSATVHYKVTQYAGSEVPPAAVGDKKRIGAQPIGVCVRSWNLLTSNEFSCPRRVFNCGVDTTIHFTKRCVCQFASSSAERQHTQAPVGEEYRRPRRLVSRENARLCACIVAKIALAHRVSTAGQQQLVPQVETGTQRRQQRLCSASVHASIDSISRIQFNSFHDGIMQHRTHSA